MKSVSRLFLTPTVVLTLTLAAVLLGFACIPSDAAGRVGGLAYDGTWSVAIYTARKLRFGAWSRTDRRRPRDLGGPKLSIQWRSQR